MNPLHRSNGTSAANLSMRRASTVHMLNQIKQSAVGRHSSLSAMTHSSTAAPSEFGADSSVYLDTEEDDDSFSSYGSDEEDEDLLHEKRTREAMASADKTLRDVDIKTNPHLKLVESLQAQGVAKASQLVALNTFSSSDFSQARNQALFLKANGVSVLVRLIMENKDLTVRKNAIALLTKLAAIPEFQVTLFDMDGLKGPLELLADERTPPPIQSAIMRLIETCGEFYGLRRAVRQANGLGIILGHLKNMGKRHAAVAPCAMAAIDVLLRSAGNRSAVKATGGLQTIVGLIRSTLSDHSNPANEATITSAVAALRHFTNDDTEFTELVACGVPEILCAVLAKIDTPAALEHVVATLAAMAQLKEVQITVHKNKGVHSLCKHLDKPGALQVSALVALRHLAQYGPNRKVLVGLKIASTIAAMLRDVDEDLVGRAALVVSSIGSNPDARQAIRRAGAVSILVGHLKSVNNSLLRDVSTALATLGEDEKLAADIIQADGVRLLWSLLRVQSSQVIAAAAAALVPLLKSPDEIAKVGRTFVGGLRIVVTLFKSKNEEVLGYAAALVAQLARDTENCQILTESNVIDDLCRLVRSTQSDLIRQHAASALAYMAVLGDNRAAIGENAVLEPLVGFFTSTGSPLVHRSTAHALSNLASHPENARVLRDVRAHVPLVKLMASTDEVAQLASAVAVRHIRLHHVKRLEASMMAGTTLNAF
ncbi:Armadillo/plakoglobin ARM repeat [Carpediemonas membranifera]|uniref:Armadillo/plakoglobin ARM repeat n=1 Tax=Carpediemonas membranifera TaxID=201153 RepID=A0A8J6E1D8_9EUKA|nr:Armadillo/plakoglobin ARM repeat [Carpediemonas membranifera]|eukprot:KAG9390502.1 Armadillo/plakoglobin ARM repeat [Carpediemonas membranifera]